MSAIIHDPKPLATLPEHSSGYSILEKLVKKLTICSRFTRKSRKTTGSEHGPPTSRQSLRFDALARKRSGLYLPYYSASCFWAGLTPFLQSMVGWILQLVDQNLRLSPREVKPAYESQRLLDWHPCTWRGIAFAESPGACQAMV